MQRKMALEPFLRLFITPFSCFLSISAKDTHAKDELKSVFLVLDREQRGQGFLSVLRVSIRAAQAITLSDGHSINIC